MTDRCQAIKNVSVSSFAMYDLALFLDTHPDDTAALSAFQEARGRRKQAMHEYEKEYGPLTLDCCEDTNHWRFGDGPAPWEGGEL